MICDHIRNIEEFEKLYNSRPMNDGIFTYEFLVKNPNLFCFYGESDNKLKGYINIYRDEYNRLFLSGASIRKNMADNINAIIMVCNAFNENMYAETDIKTAKICLLRAGFKKLDTNLYIRRFNYNG